MTSDYRIEKYAHGILVFGEVPIDEFTALAKLWMKQGWDLLAPGIASMAHASFAITKKDCVEVWTEGLRTQSTVEANGDRELEWLLGPDTGTSSLTIFSVLSEKHAGRAMVRVRHGLGPSPPWDPDDFGRCYRLLEMFPAWKERMQEVADRYPTWAKLVQDWGYLWALWEEESPSGECPKLYDAMKDCL
jgi:hypothetical protein